MFKSIVAALIVLASSACEAQITVSEVIGLVELAAPVAEDIGEAKQMTMWVAGSHSTEARFESLKSGKVGLKLADGKSISINYADLDPEDRLRAKLFAKSFKAGDAFEDANGITAPLVLMIKGLHEQNVDLESKINAQNERLVELQNNIAELKGEMVPAVADSGEPGSPPKAAKAILKLTELLKEKGTGAKTTGDFTLTGENEYLQYTFEETSGKNTTFQVMLYELESKKLVSMAVHKTGTGASEKNILKAAAGSYFLKLNATNCDWSVIVSKGSK